MWVYFIGVCLHFVSYHFFREMKKHGEKGGWVFSWLMLKRKLDYPVKPGNDTR